MLLYKRKGNGSWVESDRDMVDVGDELLESSWFWRVTNLFLSVKWKERKRSKGREKVGVWVKANAEISYFKNAVEFAFKMFKGQAKFWEMNPKSKRKLSKGRTKRKWHGTLHFPALNLLLKPERDKLTFRWCADAGKPQLSTELNAVSFRSQSFQITWRKMKVLAWEWEWYELRVVSD